MCVWGGGGGELGLPEAFEHGMSGAGRQHVGRTTTVVCTHTCSAAAVNMAQSQVSTTCILLCRLIWISEAIKNTVFQVAYPKHQWSVLSLASGMTNL